jgi:lysyl-tRNA synthetase class 2
MLALPDKFHGLEDTELRYRQRYLDLFVNPDVREVFVKRAKVLRRCGSSSTRAGISKSRRR